MPKRTDISSILVLGAPLPGGEGLGVGERGAASRPGLGVGHPHPTLPLEGEGFEVEGDSGVAVPRDVEFEHDRFDHAVGVAQHLIVPEPDHAIAVSLDLAGADVVGRIVGVLAAIDFDHQPGRTAGEVGDGVADLALPGELRPDLLAPKPRPQANLGFGRFATEPLREAGQSLSRHGLDAPTQPSPCRGRASLAQAA